MSTLSPGRGANESEERSRPSRTLRSPPVDTTSIDPDADDDEDPQPNHERGSDSSTADMGHRNRGRDHMPSSQLRVISLSQAVLEAARRVLTLPGSGLGSPHGTLSRPQSPASMTRVPVAKSRAAQAAQLLAPPISPRPPPFAPPPPRPSLFRASPSRWATRLLLISFFILVIFFPFALVLGRLTHLYHFLLASSFFSFFFWLALSILQSMRMNSRLKKGEFPEWMLQLQGFVSEDPLPRSPAAIPSIAAPSIRLSRRRVGQASSSASTSSPAAAGTRTSWTLTLQSPLAHIRMLRERRASRARAILAIQRIWRGYRCRREFAQQKRRRKIALEITLSEQSYLEQIGLAVDLYLLPLRKDALLNPRRAKLPLEPLRTIFANLEIIRQVNTSVLAALTPRTSRWTVHSSLGDIFSGPLVDSMLSYTAYINNYNTAIGTLISFEKRSSTLRDFLNRQQLLPQSLGRSLATLLITPVQRIPRYLLLLQELQRFTPTSHPDHAQLTEALHKVSSLATIVNEAKRDAESLQKVMTITEKLQGVKREDEWKFDVPSRRWVWEGSLVELTKNGEVQSQRIGFLFTDALLLAKRQAGTLGVGKSDALKFKGLLFLHGATVTDLTATRDLPNALGLRTADQQPVTLLAVSPEAKQEWIHRLRSAIESAPPPGASQTPIGGEDSPPMLSPSTFASGSNESFQPRIAPLSQGSRSQSNLTRNFTTPVSLHSLGERTSSR